MRRTPNSANERSARRCDAARLNLARTATSGPFVFDAARARVDRSRLAVLDQLLADLDARIAGLTRQLPSAGALDAQRQDCHALTAAVTLAERMFAESTQAYLQALEVAEQAARALHAARAATRDAQIRLADAVACAGLEAEVAVPALITIGRVPMPRQKVALAQTVLIAGAVQGEADSQVERELAAAVAAVELTRLVPA